MQQWVRSIGLTMADLEPYIVARRGDDLDLLDTFGELVKRRVDRPRPHHRSRTMPAISSSGSKTEPGNLFHWLIAHIGFTPATNCRCEAMRRQMNKWGWLGCVRHRKEIAQHLVTEAARVGVTVTSETVFGLMVAGIKEYRSRRKNPN